MTVKAMINILKWFFERRRASVYRSFAVAGLLLAAGLNTLALGAEDVLSRQLPMADFSSAREALVESIEAEGLTVREVIPFNRMLERTAAALGKTGSPFVNVEIVQFCSSALSWQMLEEDVTQIALCPLSIVILLSHAEPDRVTLAWRSPGQATAGRRRAGELLQKLVERAVDIGQRRH